MPYLIYFLLNIYFICFLLDIYQPLLSIGHRKVHNTVTFITSSVLCFYSSFGVEVSTQRYVWSVCLDVSKGGKGSAENTFFSHTLNTCTAVVLVHK